MGLCAEKTAAENGITRQANDEFCIESYERVLKAQKTPEFRNDIAPVEIAGKIVKLDLLKIMIILT
jgi:acetyl-CoA acetyltransferase